MGKMIFDFFNVIRFVFMLNIHITIGKTRIRKQNIEISCGSRDTRFYQIACSIGVKNRKNAIWIIQRYRVPFLC